MNSFKTNKTILFSVYYMINVVIYKINNLKKGFHYKYRDKFANGVILLFLYFLRNTFCNFALFCKFVTLKNYNNSYGMVNKENICVQKKA